MNKICTNIQQSKKLVGLGLNVNTADMHYTYRHWEIDEETVGSQSDAYIGFNLGFYYGVDNGETYHYIPAWSLTALLKLMPFHIIENNERYGFYQVKGFNKQGETYRFGYKTNNDSFLFETSLHNDVVDSAFEMVCWLKKMKRYE